MSPYTLCLSLLSLINPHYAYSYGLLVHALVDLISEP